jgi:hypothetical protein
MINLFESSQDMASLLVQLQLSQKTPQNSYWSEYLGGVLAVRTETFTYDGSSPLLLRSLHLIF